MTRDWINGDELAAMVAGVPTGKECKRCGGPAVGRSTVTTPGRTRGPWATCLACFAVGVRWLEGEAK